jgi:amidase
MPSPEKTYTVEESGAFVQTLTLEPTASGPLTGLTFGVKDLIDIGGTVTGCGNPDWARTHTPAAVNAICVDQLLAAGATCIGKTVCDELAFSLDGENYFYGTPLNPKAPDRVPGGSSSGSAAAVACGLADFALGTDTGGSIRIPASNCGLCGVRPSHGLISVAGILPFAPGFDTVGIVAKDIAVLSQTASVLLAREIPANVTPITIHVLKEALDLCDPEVRQALEGTLHVLGQVFGSKIRQTSLGVIDRKPPSPGLVSWYETFCIIQWAEIWSSLGTWVEAVQPDFGPRTQTNFALSRSLDRRLIAPAIRRRAQCYRSLHSFLGPSDLFCFPTAPALPPLKGTLGNEARSYDSQDSYYFRTLSLTAIAGLGHLPQVTLPLANAGGIPVGISFMAGYGRDAFLLAVAADLTRAASS